MSVLWGDGQETAELTGYLGGGWLGEACWLLLYLIPGAPQILALTRDSVGPVVEVGWKAAGDLGAVFSK